MRGGYPLNADHIMGMLYFHGEGKKKKKKMFSMPCDVGRLPIKGKL